MRIKTLLTALLLDLLIGDPPNKWHPVAWMGSRIYQMRQNTPESGKFLYGGFIALGGAFIIYSIIKLPMPWLFRAWILKTAFSLRGLNLAAKEVEDALRRHDLTEARRLLSWHLVSRDTSTLDESQVASAAIQSVAENTSDGIIAPLFWYGMGGLPAALAYRYLQTCDSILGYRDAEREWLGKIPARTDDVLNLIPARLTALCLIVLRPSAYDVWRKNANQTASPNAGHPMSAMAGALNVSLEKIDHYHLNPGKPSPQIDDIQRARRLMFGVVGVFVCGMIWVLRRYDSSKA